MACGLVLDASHLAGELALPRSRLVRGFHLALASPRPCMTHKNEPAATGREPFTWVYQSYKLACQAPAKISTRAELPNRPARSCGLRSHFLQKQAEGVLSRPKKGAGDAGRSGILRPPEPCLPPECLNRSVKCAAFDADLVAAPAPCRSGGLREGEAPPLLPRPVNERIFGRKGGGKAEKA